MVDESSHSNKSVKSIVQRVINSLVGDASVRLPNSLAMLQRMHSEPSSEQVATQTVKITVALSDKQIAVLQQQQHTGVVIQTDVLTGMTTISGASSVMQLVMRDLKALPDTPHIVSHVSSPDVALIPTLKEVISSFVHGFTKHITGQSTTSEFASRLVDVPVSHGSSFVAQQSLKITDVHEDVESLSEKIQAAQDGRELVSSSSVVLSNVAYNGIQQHMGTVESITARLVVGDDTLPPVSSPVVKPPVVPVDKPNDKPVGTPEDPPVTVPETPLPPVVRTGGGGSAQTSVLIESDVQPLTYAEDGSLSLAQMRVVVTHASTQVVSVSVVLSDVAAGLLATATSSGASGQPMVTSSFDGGTATWSATGDIAEVNELLGALVFIPQTNYENAVTLSINAQSGTSSGTYGFQVTAVSANDAPTDMSVSASSVNENVSVGTVVATFSGVDVDSGDVLTYSFAPSGNVDGKFSISGNQLLVAAGLNYEAATSHAITVRVTDSAGATYDESFTISVLNVNEAPSAPVDSSAATNTVAENSATGTVVGITASATDLDAGASVVYSLSNDAGGRFAIDANTGVVTVANGSLLNYESANSHSVTVVASDGSLSASSTMSIGVTDAGEAPTDVMISNASVNENSALNTLIGTLSASDDDAGSSFTYAIMSDPDSKFLLSGNQLLLNGLVNYEVKSAHNVTIRVTDNTGRSYSEVLSIAINNMNDAPILGRVW